MAVTTLGLIIGGLVAAETANNVIGSVKNAKGAKKLGDANAAIAEQQAADATARGEEAVSQVGAQERGLTGSQRASFAASGVETDSGSAADVIANDESLSELDKLAIRRNAQREAHGYQLQAKAYRKGAALQSAGYTNQAYGTLLQGAGQLLGVYQSFGLNKTSQVDQANKALDARGGAGSLVGYTPNYAAPRYGR